MLKRITCASAASLCLGLSALAGAQTSTVNFNTTYQTIHGFGGATAWTGVLSNAQANEAWGTSGSQLGLTINRARIDPGGQSNWGTELANAKLATSFGAIEFATPWTPPASMKSNNSVDDGSLNTSSYAAYASYLESFVTYMANNGVDLYAISMQNEPNFLPSYESCGWTPQQMDTWVANNSSVLTTRLMMPESTSMNFNYSDPTLDDPNAVGHVSIIAGHLYGATISYYTNAEQHGKEVWATEHYLTPANGSTPQIGDAIAAAQEVHTAMTVGQYNAYVWWWFAYPGNTSNLINSDGSATYYGYAIGQFSRFVRPGSVMVAASSPANGVNVSAYKTSTGGSIVAINSNSNAQAVNFSLSGLTPSTATPWETTSSGGLMQQGAISISGSAFSYTLPAQSIVTLVLSGSGNTSCSTAPNAPGSLSATAASSSSINLSWVAVTAPTNCTISGYAVYRSTTNGFTPSTSNQIASVTSGTTFGDTNLAASTTYYYKLEAVDSAGNSAASSQASAQTQAGNGNGSFALSPSSSSLSVTQGTSATDTITVSDSGGFSGSVSLAVSGLPSGVTATFGTNPTTGSSVVTFNASSSAATGTSTVTITGTSGSTSATTTLTLTVNPSTTTGFGCHVVYSVSSQWPSGFGAGITLENTGTTNWSSWTLTWTFANGQTISTLWNGSETQSGANVAVSNLSYNGSIPAGGSYNGMGFNGTWNNSTNSAPTSFAVNGTACH